MERNNTMTMADLIEKLVNMMLGVDIDDVTDELINELAALMWAYEGLVMPFPLTAKDIREQLKAKNNKE